MFPAEREGESKQGAAFGRVLGLQTPAMGDVSLALRALSELFMRNLNSQ